MRTPLAWVTAILFSLPLLGHARDGRAALEAAARALGAGGLRSLAYSGSGVHFALGLLPLHGRSVPIAGLHSAVGHDH